MAAAICKGPAATAGRALLDAFLAGGAAAQAAVQALVTASCPAGVDSDAASQAAYSVFVLSPELREPQEALRWAGLDSFAEDTGGAEVVPTGTRECRPGAATSSALAWSRDLSTSLALRRPGCRAATNFVAAADALGFGACVTLVVLDAAGSVLEERQIHTSRSAGGAVTAPFTEAPKLEVGSALHQPPFSAVLRIGGGGGGDLRFAPAARATPLEGGTGGAADGLSLSSRGSPVLSSGSLNATGDSECYGAFEAAIDSCAGDASQAPGSDCCGGWEALGPDCWDWLFQAAATTADHDFVTTA